MSYNISDWKTKELSSFQIPISALLECDDMDSPIFDDTTGLQIFMGLSEGFELRGEESGGRLLVDHIEYWGLASGRNFDDLKAIFKASKGTLVAILTWEGGDSIERLVVRDGSITQESVEL